MMRIVFAQVPANFPSNFMFPVKTGIFDLVKASKTTSGPQSNSWFPKTHAS